MQLEWNDISAIRGFHLNGMDIDLIVAITNYARHQIKKVIDDFEKELNEGSWK